MSRMLSWFISCLVFTVHLTAHAICDGEEKTIQLPQKYYVEMDRVKISEDQIYINVEDITYKTPALHSDEQGLYIDRIALARACTWYEWECPRQTCHACNLKIYPKCLICNWPEPDEKYNN